MRLGIITPVLTMLPSAHAAWEETATWRDVVAVAQAADRLGYDHLTCSEHVAVRRADAQIRGGRYWDPLATFGYLAAVTENIRFATYVLVLGYHHPLEIAKRYGTLDHVTGGRVVLGVGVGTLKPEFDLLGAPFDERGARADDALRALRASLGVTQPEYHGSHYDFGDVVVEPAATRRDVPLWIGGQGRRSLRRAIELGDGWAPFGLKPAAAGALVAAAGSPAIDIVLQPARPLDPVGDPEAATRTLDELRAAGATYATLRFVHHSAAHYVEQLDAAQKLQA
jgi:probable F420-dependent oxidoreductase